MLIAKSYGVQGVPIRGMWLRRDDHCTGFLLCRVVAGGTALSDHGCMATRVLSIGLLSPPWAAVPPPAYGGTEGVVGELARGLAVAGHEVVLYATGDSIVPVPAMSGLAARAPGIRSASVR